MQLLNSSQPSLTTAARNLPLGRGATATRADWIALLAIGGLTAILTAYLALNLRIPGHAILRVVVPMVVGMALVPRRGAGVVMAIGATLVGGIIHLTDTGELTPAAFVGLVIVGPMLDLAAAGRSSGRGLYLRFALTGLAVNLIVYAALGRVLDRVGDERRGRKLFRRAGLTVFGSYVLCGVLAGLIGAAIAFRPTAAGQPRE